MPVSITLTLPDQATAEVWVGEQRYATFAPEELLADHPLRQQEDADIPEQDRVPISPAQYGQRLMAALGSDIAAAIAALPLAPAAASTIAIQTTPIRVQGRQHDLYAAGAQADAAA